MDITVYRHTEQQPFHIDLTLDGGDFTQDIRTSHDVEERVRLIQADGGCLLEMVSHVSPKPEVIGEMIEAVGSSRDVAELLGVDHFSRREFEKFVTDGDIPRAARYAGRTEILQKKLKVRRDSKAVTIRNKVEETLEALSGKAHAKVVEMLDQKLEQIQRNAESKRSEYKDYILRLINHNGDQFEKRDATEIGEMRERIAGYEAMLKEAKDKIRNLKNDRVVDFALNDGTFGQNSPIAPSVLTEVKEKADKNGFFHENIFGLRE